MRKFFKIQLIILSFFASGSLFAQQVVESAFIRDGQYYIKRCVGSSDNCMAATHPVYSKSVRKPIFLKHLGTSKQFASLSSHIGSTPTEVYQNLQKAYRTDKADARELDRLWRAMGYSGFHDSSFSADRIAGSEELPAGTKGMIGNGRHTYQYAEFGSNFNGFRISSNNSCDIYIMQTCGNAFHAHGPSSADCTETIYTGGGNGTGMAAAPKCESTTLTGSKTETATIDGQFNGSQDIRILARNQGTKDKGAVLCLGKAIVPYNANYEVVVNGTASASQVVNVCPESKNQIIPITLNLQKGLTKDNKVSFGQDGRTYIDVDQKQFNALSKVFAKCCPNDCDAVK